ncbi:MAG: hypothetical protein HFE77_03180 [Clostridiales bacterium]|nr:hypothetical protein [Clostridiales bacterium]
MSKSVLRSIKPYWFYLICEGKKQIEVGKNVPKNADWNRIVELYCSKDMCSFNRIPKEFQEKYKPFIGKVGARFVCDKINKFTPTEKGIRFNHFSDLGDTCLSLNEILRYSAGKIIYGWHISDLVIYDKPRKLEDFMKCDYWSFEEWVKKTPLNHSHTKDDYKRYLNRRKMTRPPMSWCYVEEFR